MVAGHNCSPLDVVQGDIVLRWSSAVTWHGHRRVVNEQCEKLWRSGGREVSLDPSFSKLLALMGMATRVNCSPTGAPAGGVLVQFFALGDSVEGHWTVGAISREEGPKGGELKERVLLILGDDHRGPATVLELVSHSPVLCICDHSSTKKLRSSLGALCLLSPWSERTRFAERLAVEARDAANISEFRVTGSLRTAWYEGQRRDPSLAGSIRKPEPSMKISGDGLLEREVTPGQVRLSASRWSAEVTVKLLERAVWWPDLERDV